MVQYCTLSGLIVSVDMHGKQMDGHGLILVTNYGSYQPKLVMHALLHACSCASAATCVRDLSSPLVAAGGF